MLSAKEEREKMKIEKWHKRVTCVQFLWAVYIYIYGPVNQYPNSND